MKAIHYQRGDFGYRISIYPPTDKYPMYQVSCNDDDYFGVWVFPTQEATNSFIDMVLSHADAWEAAS